MVFFITPETQSYEVSVSGTASTALALSAIAPINAARRIPQLLVKYKAATSGLGAYIKLGGSTVAASDVVTSSALVKGNVFVADGAIMAFSLDDGMTHISAISEDHTDTGTLFITVGYGEE